MENKTVKLRGGQIAIILDTILENGDTIYLSLELNSKYIIFIKPRDIIEIVE